VLLPIVPQLAVHVDGALAVNCNVLLTTTVGFSGEIVSVEEAPEPESATVCGLFAAESVKLRVAVRVPPAVGLNTTEATQLADAARLVPHVLPAITKSDALVPVMPMLLIVIEELSPFLSVALCAVVVLPTVVLANVSDEGLTDTPPGAYPVSATV
jgi:hypothetical protein